MKGKCETCGCEAELTVHHLVPVVRCKNRYRAAKDDPSNRIMICRPCHDQIHACYGESELRDLYPTKELLMEAPEFRKFVEWRRRHPDFSGHSKMSNSRRR